MMKVSFNQLRGKLEATTRERHAGAPAIVLSNLTHGSARGLAWQGLVLRHVGRGAEDYRIAGRHYRVAEGQFMIARQHQGSEVEIRRTERTGTAGLCVYLPESEELAVAAQILTGPIVLPASNSPLGLQMVGRLKQLQNWTQRELPNFEAMIFSMQHALEEVVSQISTQMDQAPGAKASTRYDAVRKVNLAQAYLHDATSRIVPLAELAAAVGVSPFQLLRNFKLCVGETPATYHRKLRLRLARELSQRTGRTLESVSDQFGFSGGSSFSHAYRRTFRAVNSS